LTFYNVQSEHVIPETLFPACTTVPQQPQKYQPRLTYIYHSTVNHASETQNGGWSVGWWK